MLGKNVSKLKKNICIIFNNCIYFLRHSVFKETIILGTMLSLLHTLPTTGSFLIRYW